MRKTLVTIALVAFGVAIVAAPAVAQKLDVRDASGGGTPTSIPSGGIDYSVTVDDTGNSYEFIDATAGTQLFMGDDDLIAVTWPFDFSVYTDSYVGGLDQFEVNSNGTVHFDIGGPRTLWPNCGDVPSDIDGQWVSPLGDDLDPSSAGSVWWHVTGASPNQILTVAWLDVPEFGGTGQIDIQANFFEGSNIIVTQYIEDSAPDFLGDGVVGINAGDAITGTEVACAANGTMPRPVHDVEYVPSCSVTATINDGHTLRPGEMLWAEFAIEHAKPTEINGGRATVRLIDLATNRVVSSARYMGLNFAQFQRTTFGGAISEGLPAGRYELSITLSGMSGWNRRARQLVVIE